MCQKAGKIYKQFYNVVLISNSASPKSLQVFKLPPTERQIQSVIVNHIVGKIKPLPYMYPDKPQLHIIPIEISVDILYH